MISEIFSVFKHLLFKRNMPKRGIYDLHPFENIFVNINFHISKSFDLCYNIFVSPYDTF